MDVKGALGTTTNDCKRQLVALHWLLFLLALGTHRRVCAFWLHTHMHAVFTCARVSAQMRAHFANSCSGDAHPEKVSST